MFKVGDRVVCVIDTIESIYDTDFLKLGVVYTVSEYPSQNHCIKIEGSSYAWHVSRFELNIKYQRKQKLNKIYESVR